MTDTTKQRRGFAVMDRAVVRRIAQLGGRAVPPENRSFSKDRELASAAGRKGGLVSSRRKHQED